ncbi:hypothetical protein PMAYCL1PPCAC_06062, partial [Pristionchus mayeri]
MEPKEEPTDEPLSDCDKPFVNDVIEDIKEEEIMNDDLMELKEELFDEPLSDVDKELKDEPFLNEDMSDDIGDMNSLANDMIETRGENETAENNADSSKDSSETVEVEKRRRSTRNVSKLVRYADAMKEPGGEDEPSAKKKKSKSVEKKVVPQNKKGSSHEVATEKNELKCLECGHPTRSAKGWVKHLKVKHSTTPTLAGCLLRCDCGHESFSYNHSQKITPQCVLCEVHPKTPGGYIKHLTKYHKTTLFANDVYILCSCGFRYNSDH